MNKPDTFELFDMEDEIKFREDKVEKMANACNYYINKEDHTLGNLIRMQLLQNKDVVFAGYKNAHPLKYDIDIKIQTVPDVTPRETLGVAVNELIDQIKSLKSQFQDELAKNQKHHANEMYGSSSGHSYDQNAWDQ
ncbi:DNA-directed RNA polymerase II subunit RPB11 [Acrasis kona]|uniref:DNA-directed RNA polymerase II subunit RPB11 n=1 Tax=Acrasis kona TaxID=1008807 RepID=A0AAW2Z2Z0_9EUKA